MEKLTKSQLSRFEFYGNNEYDNYCIISTNGGQGLLRAQEFLLNTKETYIAISLLKGMGYNVSFSRNSNIKIVKFLMDIMGKEEECVGLTLKDKCYKCGGKMKRSSVLANYHNVRSTENKPEFETKHENCMKCEKCGHTYTLQTPYQHDSSQLGQSKPKSLVDFESLKDVKNIFEALTEKYAPHWKDKSDNFDLFMEKMSSSSSFAHLAHKKLKEIKERN